MPMPAPGMAAADAFEREPASFKGAILADGLDTVLRTRGRIPARCTQHRRQQVLVRLDQRNKYAPHNGL